MQPFKTPLKLALIAAMLPLAACSQQDAAREDMATGMSAENAKPAVREVAPPDAAAASGTEMPEAATPDIGAAVAPGVAFAYSYAFSLPANAISRVQQQHAAACEKLGLARCQVTGMTYVRDGEAIDARLDLLVAPDVANRLGSESIAAVEAADGKLADANVTGQNAGGAIDASQRRSKVLQAELARLEKRVAAGGLGESERSEMHARIEDLRRQLASEQTGRETSELAIASTPMQFSYGTKGVFAASDNPFGNAANVSFGSAASLLAVLMTALGLALPWLALGGLVWLALRHLALRRRLAATTATTTTEPAARG